jgi:hypothetical protein
MTDGLFDDLKDKIELLRGFVADVANYGLGEDRFHTVGDFRHAERHLQEQARQVLSEFTGTPRELSRD